jgi:hypothetical protein
METSVSEEHSASIFSAGAFSSSFFRSVFLSSSSSVVLVNGMHEACTVHINSGAVLYLDLVARSASLEEGC